MRVLLTADLHYTLQQFDWLQGVAADYDFVVLAGDLLDVASPVPKSGQLVTVLEHLRRLSGKTGLAVCSGNHDLTARNAAGEKYADWMTQVRELGIPCDGDRFDAEGMAVTICPWWDGPASQAAVGAQLAAFGYGSTTLRLQARRRPALAQGLLEMRCCWRGSTSIDQVLSCVDTFTTPHFSRMARGSIGWATHSS